MVCKGKGVYERWQNEEGMFEREEFLVVSGAFKTRCSSSHFGCFCFVKSKMDGMVYMGLWLWGDWSSRTESHSLIGHKKWRWLMKQYF